MIRRILAALAVIGAVFVGFGTPAHAASTTPPLGSLDWSSSGESLPYSTDTFYIVDTTGVQWPIGTAITTANNYFAANHQVVRFAKTSTCGGKGDRCFYILEGPTGSNQAAVAFPGDKRFPGVTPTPANPAWCNMTGGGGITVQPGDTAKKKWTLNQRAGIALHEMYHMIGLGHNPDSGDIMNAQYENGVGVGATTPSVQDSLALIRAYGSTTTASSHRCN